MGTKCAITDAFVRDCFFAYFPIVAQYVYSLSAKQFSDYAKKQSRTNASEIVHVVRNIHHLKSTQLLSQSIHKTNHLERDLSPIARRN